MKNGLLYLGLVLFLTGCSSKNTDLKEPDNFRAESSAAIQPDETTPEGETAISGTYAVPEEKRLSLEPTQYRRDGAKQMNILPRK